MCSLWSANVSSLKEEQIYHGQLLAICRSMHCQISPVPHTNHRILRFQSILLARRRLYGGFFNPHGLSNGRSYTTTRRTMWQYLPGSSTPISSTPVSSTPISSTTVLSTQLFKSKFNFSGLIWIWQTNNCCLNTEYYYYYYSPHRERSTIKIVDT